MQCDLTFIIEYNRLNHAPKKYYLSGVGHSAMLLVSGAKLWNPTSFRMAYLMKFVTFN